MKNKSIFLVLKQLLKHYKASIIKFIKVSSYVKITLTAIKYIYRFGYWSIAALISFLATVIWELGDLQEAICWILSFKDQILIQIIQFLRNLLSDNAVIKMNKIIAHAHKADVIKFSDYISINSPNDEYESLYLKYIYYTLIGISVIIIGGVIYNYHDEIYSLISNTVNSIWSLFSSRTNDGGAPRPDLGGAGAAHGNTWRDILPLPENRTHGEINDPSKALDLNDNSNKPYDLSFDATPKASSSNLPSRSIYGNDSEFPGAYDNLQKDKSCILPPIPDNVPKDSIKIEGDKVLIQPIDEYGNKGDWFDPSKNFKTTNSTGSDIESLKSNSSFKKGLGKMFKPK